VRTRPETSSSVRLCGPRALRPRASSPSAFASASWRSTHAQPVRHISGGLSPRTAALDSCCWRSPHLALPAGGPLARDPNCSSFGSGELGARCRSRPRVSPSVRLPYIHSDEAPPTLVVCHCLDDALPGGVDNAQLRDRRQLRSAQHLGRGSVFRGDSGRVLQPATLGLRRQTRRRPPQLCTSGHSPPTRLAGAGRPGGRTARELNRHGQPIRGLTGNFQPRATLRQWRPSRSFARGSAWLG
jgi:hypothetical protein